MKKFFKRFRNNYVSRKSGRSCSWFTFLRYHFAVLSIPGLLLAIFVPPVGMLIAVLAMLSVVFTCPIRLIKSMAKPLRALFPKVDLSLGFKAGLIAYAVCFGLFFLCGWVVALFYMFVCPWALTLKKFDEKFIDRDEYEKAREEEMINRVKANLEANYGREEIEQAIFA